MSVSPRDLSKKLGNRNASGPRGRGCYTLPLRHFASLPTIKAGEEYTPLDGLVSSFSSSFFICTENSLISSFEYSIGFSLI